MGADGAVYVSGWKIGFRRERRHVLVYVEVHGARGFELGRIRAEI